MKHLPKMETPEKASHQHHIRSRIVADGLTGRNRQPERIQRTSGFGEVDEVLGEVDAVGISAWHEWPDWDCDWGNSIADRPTIWEGPPERP